MRPLPASPQLCEPALVLRTGAAHGWLPRHTGGANCGTQYPVWRGGALAIVLVSRQEKCMNIFRLGFPTQGGWLLLGLLLWSLLPWRDCVGAGRSPSPATASAEGAQVNGRPSPGASQDLASQLHALKAAIPDSQRRIASSIRGAAQML